MLTRETSQRETVASGRVFRRWRCIERGRRRLACFRVRRGGESVVDLVLPAAQSGEFVGAVPRRTDARRSTVGFTASRVGFGLEGRQGVGQALDLAFEAGDEVGGSLRFQSSAG